MNLMNLNTFDKLMKDRTVLEPTSLRMEAYGNNAAVTVLEKFYAFPRWKGHVYRHVTNAISSPNLLFRDGCYTLGVLNPCYSVEMTQNSSKYQSNIHTAYNPFGQCQNAR